jgi:phosphoserine phosphatase RsbU/P
MKNRLQPDSRPGRLRTIYSTFTRDLKSEDLQQLFTRDTREAYRFFARGIDREALAALPWWKRGLTHLRLFFLAFSMKLPPARRALYGAAVLTCLIGLLKLFQGVQMTWFPLIPFVARVGFPTPVWTSGTLWLFAGFLLLNLLVMLEVADRLVLKNDLEIARDIQSAMLPRGPLDGVGFEAYGATRPANTVGGDFYDLQPLPDGRLVVAVGDVAGKGSPAALLMALLLAIQRTLVDEGLPPAELVSRLNVQVSRHAPPSRFITLFYAVYDPATGFLDYVNAGHNPPMLLRRDGRVEWLSHGGTALGMFEASSYSSLGERLEPGDMLVLYSDGITEAENPDGTPFEEAGLEALMRASITSPVREIGPRVFQAVERHARDTRLQDDLTLLLLRRENASRTVQYS